MLTKYGVDPEEIKETETEQEGQEQVRSEVSEAPDRKDGTDGAVTEAR